MPKDVNSKLRPPYLSGRCHFWSLMRYFLLALVLAASSAHAQTMVLACPGQWGSSSNCGGCSAILWTSADPADKVKSDSSDFWTPLSTLLPEAKVITSTGKSEGQAVTQAECQTLAPNTTVAAVLVPPPPPLQGDVTLTWTPPTQNVDNTPLTNLTGYRIEYGPDDFNTRVTVGPSLTRYILTDLEAGTWQFRLVSLSGSGESLPSNSVSAEVTGTEPPPTCGSAPPIETRSNTCPAPFVGAWTQTRTSTAAPPPTCWVPDAWVPATPPAGMCAAPSALVTAGPLAYVPSSTAMVFVGYVAANLPCGPETKTVAGVKYCHLAYTQVDLVNSTGDLTRTNLWGKSK